MKIAVITTCQKDFDKYVRSQPEKNKKNIYKISVLRDLIEKQYDKSVILVESKNVTDKVIRDTLSRSLELHDLSKETTYY